MKMESYDKMLDELYSKLPEKTQHKERFEMPKVEITIEGNKTLFRNFSSIAQKIRRDEQYIAKFLSREVAAPVKKERDMLIIQRKINRNLLQKKLEIYIKDYVLCLECGKPDTKIVNINGIKTLICEACGARRPIR